jgi:hypothetical protein
LYNGTDAVFLSSPIYTLGLSASFPDASATIDLNPNKTNLMVLNATNFDTVIDDPTLPAQVLFSDSAAFIPVPVIDPTSANPNQLSRAVKASVTSRIPELIVKR